VELKADGLTPTITFYLDLPVFVALERLKNRKFLDKFENKELLEKVRQGYLTLVKTEPKFYVLDATLDKDTLFAKTLKILSKEVGYDFVYL